MIQWTTFHLIYDYSLIFSSYILFIILFSFICAFCILKIIETLPTQLIHIFYVNNRQNHLIHLYEANAAFNSHLIRAQRAIVERTKTNTQKKNIFFEILYIIDTHFLERDIQLRSGNIYKQKSRKQMNTITQKKYFIENNQNTGFEKSWNFSLLVLQRIYKPTLVSFLFLYFFFYLFIVILLFNY